MNPFVKSAFRILLVLALLLGIAYATLWFMKSGKQFDLDSLMELGEKMTGEFSDKVGKIVTEAADRIQQIIVDLSGKIGSGVQ